MQPRRNIVAIGASAGGVEAVSRLLSKLPPHLPASVVVAVHRAPDRPSQLHQVLSRATHLPVLLAHEGDALKEGACLVGGPERHLTVGPDLRVHLLHDGFYRGHCIDALFCSLARHAGTRTIGVILSGLLKDGTFGLKAIKEAGGVALVQSPQEAAYSDMPESAIAHGGSINLVAGIDDLAAEISRLVRTGTRVGTSASC
jgi:two-component system chemotaxis response regulator CheB